METYYETYVKCMITSLCMHTHIGELVKMEYIYLKELHDNVTADEYPSRRISLYRIRIHDKIYGEFIAGYI